MYVCPLKICFVIFVEEKVICEVQNIKYSATEKSFIFQPLDFNA